MRVRVWICTSMWVYGCVWGGAITVHVHVCVGMNSLTAFVGGGYSQRYMCVGREVCCDDHETQ